MVHLLLSVLALLGLCGRTIRTACTLRTVNRPRGIRSTNSRAVLTVAATKRGAHRQLLPNSTATRLFQSPQASASSSVSATLEAAKGSAGVESLIQFLNGEAGAALAKNLALANQQLSAEASKANFWTGGNFVIQGAQCTGVTQTGIDLNVQCLVKDKPQTRQLTAPFPSPVSSEFQLKTTLIDMARQFGRARDTGEIAKLPFGHSAELPDDFRFNDVPHKAWVRSYLYDSVANAVLQAVRDESIPSRSKLQLKVNIPETNPAFDTYRIGTILEMVRSAVLALLQEDEDKNGKKVLRKVKICVQQSLGEGIFTGLPLALSSMRPVLERMDWGQSLTEEEKFRPSDNEHPREEARLRFGTIGADQVAEDDDVFLLIAPQNVIGGMVIGLLEEMVTAANGRPIILINPNLDDRPSSNNRMQIRGRAERKAFANSFCDIFAMRLLYPSSGGYMFPIRGMVGKTFYDAPWVVYSKENESFTPIAAFGPYSTPTASEISDCFLK